MNYERKARGTSIERAPVSWRIQAAALGIEHVARFCRMMAF
jgi:hypothetical protein